MQENISECMFENISEFDCYRAVGALRSYCITHTRFEIATCLVSYHENDHTGTQKAKDPDSTQINGIQDRF